MAGKITTTEVLKNGKTYVRMEFEDGTFIEKLKPPTGTFPKPKYKEIMENENVTKIQTGALTAAERDKLLVAIAMKLGIV